MEILDSEIKNFRWLFRPLTYFLYALVLSGCLLWNTFGVATIYELPFSYGCSGGCHVESPFIIGFGVMGIMFYVILFFQKTHFLKVLIKGVIVVLLASILSWVLTSIIFSFKGIFDFRMRPIFVNNDFANIFLSSFFFIFYISIAELFLFFSSSLVRKKDITRFSKGDNDA